MPAPSTGTVVLARRLYADGVPVAAIIEQTNLTTDMLYRCLDGVIAVDGEQLPKLPRRKDILGVRRKPARVNRASLVSRLWSTAERQVRDIETRLHANQQEPSERERDARVLSVLVKTLRELSAFDEEQRETNTDVNAADDDFPRDADELRRELARKIEGLRAIHAGSAGGAETA